jgi:hypothetical protein
VAVRTIFVWEKPRVISVHQQSESVWIVVGEYMGVLIKMEGSSAEGAASLRRIGELFQRINWRDVAYWPIASLSLFFPLPLRMGADLVAGVLLPNVVGATSSRGRALSLDGRTVTVGRAEFDSLLGERRKRAWVIIRKQAPMPARR